MSLTADRERLEPDSKSRLRLWLRLLRVTRGIESELREKLRVDHGTTLPRFDVMAALSRHSEGLKMSELSGVLRVSNGNVTGIIERLVDEGHVVRIPVAGDRRASAVKLTTKGQNEFAHQAAAHEAWINTALAGLDATEAQEMANRLSEMMEEGERHGA